MKFKDYIAYFEANSEDPIVKHVLNLMGKPKGLFWLAKQLKLKSLPLEPNQIKNPEKFYVEFELMTRVADILQKMPKTKIKALYDASQKL
jgi:hypothetical protein